MKRLVVAVSMLIGLSIQAAEIHYLHRPGEDRLYVVFQADGSTFSQVAAGQPAYTWADVTALGTAIYGSVPPWMAHCEVGEVSAEGNAVGETAGVGYNSVTSFTGATVDFDLSANPVLWTTPYFMIAPGGSQQRIFGNTDPSLGLGIAHARLNGTALTVRPDASYDLNLSTPAPAAPIIDTQPASQTVDEGATVAFSVVAHSGFGLPLLTYQWKKDGTTISGATDPAYTITAAHTTDNGSYSCTVTNVIVETVSATATLTVETGVPQPTLAFTYSADGRKLTAVVDADGAAIGSLFAGSPPDIMLARFVCWTADSTQVYRQEVFTADQPITMVLPGNTLMTRLDGVDSNGDDWEAALWNWTVPATTTDGHPIQQNDTALVFGDRPPEMSAMSVPYFFDSLAQDGAP